MTDLTPKQARFVDEYLVDLNATQAAIRAGYSAKTAQPASSRLLSDVMVAAAIAERREKLAAAAGVTVEKIVKELAKLGFSDIRKAIKWNGHLIREEDNPDGGDVLVIKTIVSNHVTLLDSDELDDDTAAAVAQISQNATGGISLKMHDKRSALVDLGKHLGMFVPALHRDSRMAA
jgi:phage terminase small subunit